MKNLIGTKNFYRKTMLVALPIMIQNGITNFVGLLDNIMIGRIGTDQMTAVAIVNQLLFVWNLCVFGGLAGIGIFTAQFYGKRDEENVRNTMRLQVLLAFLLTAAGLGILAFFGDALVSLYLHEDGSEADTVRTLAFARQYMQVMYLGLLPFALSQVYSTTLRSCGETVLPMNAGLLAVVVNLVGNYLLIYGAFGLPALGVVGAAAATVLSRFAELLFCVVSSHRRTDRYPYLTGVYRSFRVPGALTLDCVRKGLPLLLNEALWSGGQAVLTQNYSLRGLSVMAAFNISTTLSNVFNISFIAMGNAIAILIGQQLGAGQKEEARRDAMKHTFFSFMICVLAGLLMLLLARPFPRIYNTSEEVRETARGLITIGALCLPVYSIANAAYFILRSGGKTFITFLFDSCFVWVFSIPAAHLLVHRTGMDIVPLFLCVQLLDLIKCAIGLFLVQRGVWVNDITVSSGGKPSSAE